LAISLLLFYPLKVCSFHPKQGERLVLSQMMVSGV
jgi:hypothetical protein